MQAKSTRLLGAVLLVLAASAARVVIERLRGVVHADSDVLALFLPTFAWWWSRLRLPGGWNPWVFGGHPANADPQVAPLHPLGLAYAALDPLAAATVEGVLAPALGGIGMLVYLRTVGCRLPPALVGALSFALGGYFTGHATNPGLMRAALAVPWALAVIERLEGRALVAGFAAASGLLLLSGHPQSIAYALALVLAYAAVFGRLRDLRRLAALGAGLALGLGLAAAVLLPAEEFVRLSSRALGEMEGHADPRLTWAAALGLFLPFPRGGSIGPLWGTSYQAPTGCGLIECSGYPGTLPLLAVIACLPLLVRSGRGRFWLVAGVAGAVLATGVLGAGTATLRAPVRFLLWWNVAVPAAAGLALEGVKHAPRRRAVAAAAAVLAVALAATWLVDPPSRRVVVGSLAVLALATAVLFGARRSVAGATLLVAFVWLEMVAYLASLPFGVPQAAYERAVHATGFLREADPAVAEAASPPRYLVVPLLRFADWAPFSRTLLVQGYNSLLPARTAGLLGPRPGAALAEVGWVGDPSLAEPSSHVLDLLRVRVIAVPPDLSLPLARELEAQATAGDGRFASLGRTGDGAWQLIENRRARPLAWVVHRVRVASPEEARELVREDPERAFDPAAEALVARPIPGLSNVAPSPAAAARVELLSFDEDEIRLVAETSAAGLLVTSELAYPGWTATVDGASREVETVNAGFRAVRLEPGRHEVVLAYRPWRSRVGLAVSAASALVVLALALAARRRAR